MNLEYEKIRVYIAELLIKVIKRLVSALGYSLSRWDGRSDDPKSKHQSTSKKADKLRKENKAKSEVTHKSTSAIVQAGKAIKTNEYRKAKLS